uniref:class II histocompatibility antigen, B-L beta chain-like isoform X2 n=1 Tax=Pristiophorus japonicus TaxID=55135 RepID=UPI00398EB1C4
MKPWGLLWIAGPGLLCSAALAFHTGQLMLSCDSLEPPVIVLRFAYDGEELGHFNYTTKKFVANNPLVEPFFNELNSNPKTIKNTDRYSHYMPFLKETILQATQTLTAKPSIAITTQRLNGGGDPLLLNCRVDGFYPRDINATWLWNGEAVEQEVLKSRILPNKDGTFQLTLQLTVDPERGDSYTCQLEHRSAPDKLTAVWAPKSKNLAYGYVVGIILGIAGIVIATSGGIIRWKGVWSQDEAEHLCAEIGQSPSPVTADVTFPSNNNIQDTHQYLETG